MSDNVNNKLVTFIFIAIILVNNSRNQDNNYVIAQTYDYDLIATLMKYFQTYFTYTLYEIVQQINLIFSMNIPTPQPASQDRIIELLSVDFSPNPAVTGEYFHIGLSLECYNYENCEVTTIISLFDDAKAPVGRTQIISGRYDSGVHNLDFVFYLPTGVTFVGSPYDLGDYHSKEHYPRAVIVIQDELGYIIVERDVFFTIN